MAQRGVPELAGSPLSNGLKRLDVAVDAVTTLLNETAKRGKTQIVTSRVRLVTRGRRLEQ
jgi:hypothetical protein